MKLDLFQQAPDYRKLRVFGPRCYPCLRSYQPNKLSQKSVPCVFLGYLQNQDAYLCYDLVGRKMYSLRDVRFNEEDFTLNKYLAEEQEANITQSPAERRAIYCPIIREKLKEVSGHSNIGPSQLINKEVSGSVCPNQSNKEVLNSAYPIQSNPDIETQSYSPNSTEEEESGQTISDPVTISENPILTCRRRTLATNKKHSPEIDQLQERQRE